MMPAAAREYGVGRAHRVGRAKAPATPDRGHAPGSPPGRPKDAGTLRVRPIALRELLVIEVRVRPVVDLGGGRRYVPFEGGTFAGRDGLAGTILEGGIDWQRVRPDGVLEIDAHYTLCTDRDETIEVRSRGLRKASDEVTERLARGDPVDPDEYYFRTHVRLSTSSPRLGWLNDLLGVSTGSRDRSVVRIDVHEVR